MTGSGGLDKPPRTRMKYAQRACSECKRRKIRCSGDQPCRACRTSRNRVCIFGPSQNQTHTDYPSLPGPLSYQQPPRLEGTSSEVSPVAAPLYSLTPFQGGDTVNLGRATEGNELSTRPVWSPDSALREVHDVDGGASFSAITATVGPLSRDNSPYILSRLYPDQRLGRILKQFFDELELFYPCIDRADFYQRLSDFFIIHCSCEGNSTRIPLKAEHLSLAALTCTMLAVGTYTGGMTDLQTQVQEDDQQTQSSYLWHLESRRLLSQFLWLEEPNLDLVRLHVLEIIYMTMLDRRGGITKAVSVAVDLAYSLGLNDERSWSSCSRREQEHRRLLWWTMYYMDRRVAIKFKRPILIREGDYVVAEHSEISIDEYLGDCLPENPLDDPFSHSSCSSSSGWLRIAWSAPAAAPQDYLQWLIFIVRWSKTVSQVWDSVFSPRASESTALPAIERTDATLSKMQAELPSTLAWKWDNLPARILPGAMDRTYRLRLIVFELINLLRLSARARWVRSDPAAQQTIESLASSALDTIISYLTLRRYIRPWSTYATVRLVEVCSEVAPVVRGRLALTDTACRAMVSMSNAHTCLQQLAGVQLAIARRASTSLMRMLDEMKLLHPASVPGQLAAPGQSGALVRRQSPSDGARAEAAAAAAALDCFDEEFEAVIAGGAWAGGGLAGEEPPCLLGGAEPVVVVEQVDDEASGRSRAAADAQEIQRSRKSSPGDLFMVF